METYFTRSHNYRASITAECDGMLDSTTEGGRPTGAYIPRFRNVHKQETDFLRGYATTFSTGRQTIDPVIDGLAGAELRGSLLGVQKTGPWSVGSQCMGETIPKLPTMSALSIQKKMNGVCN